MARADRLGCGASTFVIAVLGALAWAAVIAVALAVAGAW